jgi:hypothetical protein
MAVSGESASDTGVWRGELSTRPDIDAGKPGGQKRIFRVADFVPDNLAERRRSCADRSVQQPLAVGQAAAGMQIHSISLKTQHALTHPDIF